MSLSEVPYIKKWVQALRSGKYKQSRGILQDAKGYCCLGVACKVFIPENKLEYQSSTMRLLGTTLPDQPYFPIALGEIIVEVENKLGNGLILLNDLGIGSENLDPFTFDEIADVLEAVCILKVLDN